MTTSQGCSSAEGQNRAMDPNSLDHSDRMGFSATDILIGSLFQIRVNAK
jgi:hypothetical protein